MKTYFHPKTVIYSVLILVTVGILTAFSGQAISRDYIAHQLTGNSLALKTTDGTVAINALNSSAFEVHYQPEGFKQLPSFALTTLLARQDKSEDGNLTVVSESAKATDVEQYIARWRLSTSHLLVFVTPNLNGDHIAR